MSIADVCAIIDVVVGIVGILINVALNIKKK